MATKEPHTATTNPEERLQNVEEQARHLRAVIEHHGLATDGEPTGDLKCSVGDLLKRVEAIEQSLRPTATKGKVKE